MKNSLWKDSALFKILHIKHFLVLIFPVFCTLQWVKTPLLSSRHRGVCEKSSMDIWKFRLSTRLPAHLCACALLGKVAQLSAFVPCEQKQTDCPPHFSNLMYTGTHTHCKSESFCVYVKLLFFYMFIYVYFSMAVSELLYALQWCKEVEYSPTLVASYHSLLTDWGLSEGLHSQVPMKHLLETLYSRWATLIDFMTTKKLKVKINILNDLSFNLQDPWSFF